MNLHFVPEDDMLYLELSTVPSHEGEEVTEGIVFHYDAEGRLVSIEIDEASRRVNLEDTISSDRGADGTASPGQILTTAEAAARLGVTPFAVQKIRKAMREAGVPVGIRPDRADSLLCERDLESIRQWRLEHPRGRPPKAAQA